MGALFIDNDTREKITAVIAHAEKNIFSMDDLLDLLNKQALPAGDRKGFSCIIPVGYRCVYSLEMQNPGLCRHLTISVPAMFKLPSIPAVEMIIEEFGFSKMIE